MGAAALSLQSLADMAHDLTQGHSLDNVLETAAEDACVALSAASVSFSQYEPEHDRIRTIVNVGDLAPNEDRWPTDEFYRLRGNKHLMSAILERRSSSHSVTDPNCPPHDRELLEALGKGSSLVSAILVDGRSWGEFYVTRHIGAPTFDDDDVAYAEVVAAILGAAVSRVMREKELQHLAFHDSLTGLLNRRGLDDRAEQMFDLGGEAARTVAVVAIDIDGLKNVNDTEGHAKGDQVIRRTAAAMSFACEGLESSVLARVGGDEFTILVSGADVEVIEHRVNSMTREVFARSTRVGLSVGIASVVLTATSTLTATHLFAAADRALYVAKRTQSTDAVIADDFDADGLSA